MEDEKETFDEETVEAVEEAVDEAEVEKSGGDGA